jgi:hypothetical protein
MKTKYEQNIKKGEKIFNDDETKNVVSLCRLTTTTFEANL